MWYEDGHFNTVIFFIYNFQISRIGEKDAGIKIAR
jgi:hypothetical protein